MTQNFLLILQNHEIDKELRRFHARRPSQNLLRRRYKTAPVAADGAKILVAAASNMATTAVHF